MIKLIPISLPEDYRKEWNEHSRDFVNLYVDGVKVNDNLYRVGGFGCYIDKDYFMLIKHNEALYDDSITKDPKRKKHLEGVWVILDRKGVEKQVFKPYRSPYITGGMVYSLDNQYFNIETGELYCRSYHSFITENYIFLHNQFDNDEKKRGVLKINKKDGTYELLN